MKNIIFITVKKKNLPLWSEEEDNIIKNFINLKQKNKWKIIASKLLNKTPQQIYLRSKIIDPHLKKGKFSKEEDDKLKKLVDIFGYSWTFLSKFFKNRNSKQLRLRYTINLNHKLSKKKFSQEEDKTIMNLYKIYGNQWRRYKDHLSNRSNIKIKSRCLSLLKKLKKANDSENMNVNNFETSLNCIENSKSNLKINIYEGDSEIEEIPTASETKEEILISNCSKFDNFIRNEKISKSQFSEKCNFSLDFSQDMTIEDEDNDVIKLFLNFND